VTSSNLRFLGILGILCLFCYGNARYLKATRNLALAMNIIDQVYVENPSGRQLYRAAISGMLKSLDANSSYIAQEQLQSFQSIFEQEFGGLGIGVEGPPRRPQWTIMTTIFNSPAFKAGLRPADIIETIDGAPIGALPFEDVSRKLRGREGTSVILGLQRDGESFSKSIVRDRVEIESVIGDRRREDGTWEFLMQADPRIAYVRIELFGEKTVAEFERAIASCNPRPSGLIIDLRDNSGGLLVAATQICDLFLDEGQIVTTRGRGDRLEEEIQARPGTILPADCPIAIVINENSASASEILAGCLKDRGRGIVVGARSYGKGSVQNVIPIEGGRAAMRLTTAYYYPPSGRRIHRRDPKSMSGEWGVDPNEGCNIELTDEQLDQTIDRFRMRSQPPPPLSQEKSEPSKDAQASGQSSSRSSDPSLDVDAQLSLAVERLQGLLP